MWDAGTYSDDFHLLNLPLPMLNEWLSLFLILKKQLLFREIFLRNFAVCYLKNLLWRILQEKFVLKQIKKQKSTKIEYICQKSAKIEDILYYLLLLIFLISGYISTR